VRDFNVALQRFPTNIFGAMLGFKAFAFFAAVEGEREAPTVQFAPTPPPS